MKEKRAKILVCDDEISIIEVLRTVLSEKYDVITAERGQQAIELFRKEFPDLIILDVSMPGMTGFEVLDKIKDHLEEKYIPVIFLTASIKIDDKLKALHGGAVDYLVKPVSPDELIARIQNFLELKKKHDTLKKEATFDWLTGALNKGYFLRRAKEELEKSQRNKVPLTFMLVDIDHFKEINDTLGHLAGDRVICEFAERLKHFVRKIDVIGRFGGDEFMFVLSHKTGKEARLVAERLKKAMKKPIIFEKNRINLTFSMGIVEIEQAQTIDIKELLTLADKALYEAKMKGGDRYVIK
ncbi:MAG: diguanylate cyclase [Candidatus Omnitrophota bacterium]|nr:MAG: diguanylate cyclase [Candidatus Omnitrophota bacterium]